MRKHRKGEVLCECHSYAFKHRMTGGSCKASDFILEYFNDNSWGDCRSCINFEFDCGPECSVANETEDFWECPALQDFLDRNEVPVPKRLGRKNWG